MSRRGPDGTVYSQTVWDEPKKPNIVYLMSERGEQIGFIEKACVQIGNRFFGVMQPVKPLDGMRRDDVLVFEVTVLRNGQENWSIVLDNRLYNEIMHRYRTGQCQYVN